MEVAEDSNSICNEECEYPLSEEELDSDPGNISDDSFGYQKSQNSYSAVTENSTSPNCSSSLSQIVSIVPPNGTLLSAGYIIVLSSYLAKFNFWFYKFQKLSLPGIWNVISDIWASCCVVVSQYTYVPPHTIFVQLL